MAFSITLFLMLISYCALFWAMLIIFDFLIMLVGAPIRAFWNLISNLK